MVEEVTDVGGAFCIGAFVSCLHSLDIQRFHRRMQSVHQKFDGFAENVIDEHVNWRMEKGKRIGDDRVKDLVDVMLDMAEMEGKTISRTTMKEIMLDMLAAGMETLATLVEWVVSESLRTAAALARVQQEIESAIGRDRIVKESDITDFDYLRCVVNETFRLHPPVPLLVPHESMEGCSVRGYFVPPKTRVFVNVWVIGRDKNVWKDAHQFKPERFMGSSKDARGQDFDLLPFRTGRTGCPGISMGLAVSELALAQLIHYFDWTVEGEVDMRKDLE